MPFSTILQEPLRPNPKFVADLLNLFGTFCTLYLHLLHAIHSTLYFLCNLLCCLARLSTVLEHAAVEHHTSPYCHQHYPRYR